MRADKIGVVQIFGQHHVRHRAHHRGVGARADGNPLVGEGGGRERVTRVNANHARAVFPRKFDEVIGVGAVAHLGGVPAPHDDVAAVEPVLPLVARDERAVDGGRGDVGRAPRIGVVNAETAAKEIHQTAGDVRPVELVITPRAVRDEKRVVAVLGLDSNHLAGDFAQSLVPRNADELPLAALPHPFQRIQQPIGMILSAQIGTSAGAGA